MINTNFKNIYIIISVITQITIEIYTPKDNIIAT